MPDMTPNPDGLWELPNGQLSTLPPEFADFPDKDGWAPLQPLPEDLPDALRQLPRHGNRHGTVQVCDVGEDGEMLILGHLGKRLALDVFWERVRLLCGADDANARICQLSNDADIERSLQFVAHRWAVLEQRCATYPNCQSLGPVADGKPCHDTNGVDGPEGAGYDEHQWGGWVVRPDDLRPAHMPHHVLRHRFCYRCDLTEVERVSGLDVLRNPCPTCREIDDADGLYFRWNATPGTPGAFPITLWDV